MANEDHIRFEASFAELDQYTARAKALLEEQLQRAVALGAEGEQLVSDIRSQLGALEGVAGAGATRGPGQIQRSTEAVRQETEAVAQQNRAWLEQAAIMERLQAAQRRQGMYRSFTGAGPTTAEIEAQLAAAAARREPGGLYASRRGGGAYGALAGQQVAQEERAAAAIEQQRAEEARLLQQEEQLLAAKRQEEAIQSAINVRLAEASRLGRMSGAAGIPLPGRAHGNLMVAPTGVPPAQWGAAEQEAVHYQVALGRQEGQNTRLTASNAALTQSFTRLGIQEAEASNSLRRHGALTTEFLQALARGETTIGELGYQVGATTAKFAGWTAAAAGTYAALGVFMELGRGAIDAASGVQQLTRTIPDLDKAAASTGLQRLSEETNVSMKEASDAVFLYSRTFHDLPSALQAARDGLSVFKLDQVSLTDTTQLATSVFQQFGATASQQAQMWNMLAAGQREYNARISQTVPLLRTATGAVHNAGGDLNQLIQLSVLATRIYPGMGGQIGTAFARGAATYTPKNLRDLQSNFGIGIGAEGQNWTQLLQDAIIKSGSMSAVQRRRLAADIFDPRFGSRLAGIFGPQAAATLETITGRGREAITPRRTEGALQEELQRQLGTTRERMHAFTNELQRTGAAIGSTGVISAFNLGLRGLVGTLHAGRDVVDAFGALPGPMRETVIGLEALAVALLFMSRTRIGSTLADLTHLSALPGVGASPARRARFDLRVGTRAAQQAVEGDLAQSSSRLLQLEAQQNVLQRQRQAILGNQKAQVIARNELQDQIDALEREQTVLQGERNAQLAVQADLAKQQVGLRRSASRGGYTNEEVLALGRDPMIGTAARDAEQTGGFLARAGGTLKALPGGITSFVNGIGIFNAALIGLPIALGLIAQGVNALNDSVKRTEQLSQAPITDINSLAQRARDFAEATQREHDQLSMIGHPFPHLGPLQKPDVFKTALHTAGWAAQNVPRGFSMVWETITGKYQQAGADEIRRAAQGKELGSLAVFYQNAADLFAKDSDKMAAIHGGRQRLGTISAQMEGRMRTLLSASGLPQNEINNISEAFAKALHESYESAVQRANARTDPKHMPQFLGQLEGQTPKWIEGQVQAYSQRAVGFGTGDPTNLSRAIASYLYLAQSLKKNTDPTSLQALETAQGQVVQAVTKNVDIWTKMAQGATTAGGQAGDLRTALGQITTAHAALDRWLKFMEEHYKGQNDVIKAVQNAARQIGGQLNDQLKTVIQDQLALLKTQSDLTTSRIQGFSPEADISRAQSALSGLREQLSQARASGADYQTVAGLMTQINDAERALIKQQIDNARSVVEAIGKLATSRITGVTPADDIARAHQDVTNAAQLLSFDRAHGAGQAQILQDQAAVFDAQRNLNSQFQQRNEQTAQDMSALIEAEGALAESQTTNPIAIARDQLRTAIRVLGTIKPQDYKTYQEYRTAVIEQQAKIGDARKSLTEANLQVQMDTLKFELHTQQITDQEYIDGLNRLLKMRKLSLQDRQRILGEIYDTAHSAAVNLNTDNIRLPTTYEVRRAIASAVRGGRAHIMGAQAVVQSNVTNHVSVVNHITVAHDGQLKKVADTISGTLRTHTQGLAQAAGVI